MRDFDGPMSGSFYITHENLDLHMVYKVGEEIITYQNLDDCIEKVRYYLDNDEVRESVAIAGYRRAVRDHQWKKRFQGVFNLIGIPVPR